MLEIQEHPEAIAGGVAVGVFLGLGPLFGLKTLLALGLAWLFGYSKIAAVISVSLHDILTPIVPMLMRLEYDIGYWLMSHPHHLPQKLEVHHLHLHLGDMLKWSVLTGVGLPLLVGSICVALPAAVLAYFAMLALLRRRAAEMKAND